MELGRNSSRNCPIGMKAGLLADIEWTAHCCIVDARNLWEKAQGMMWYPLDKAMVKVQFLFRDNRRRDADNYIGNRGWKRIQDLLVQDGIIRDDSWQHCTIGHGIGLSDEDKIVIEIEILKKGGE